MRCKPKASKASRVFFLNARERTPQSGCFYFCRPQRQLADFQVMALTRLVRHSSFHGLTKPRTNKVLEKLGVLRTGRGAHCIHLKLASVVQRTRGRFLSWFDESINTTVAYQLCISPTDTSLYLPALKFVQSAEHLRQRVCCDRLTGMSFR